MPEVALERGAYEPEDEHVQTEVQRPVVQERRGGEAPPLAVGHDRAEEHAVLVDPVAGAVDLAAEQQLEQEHARHSSR